MDEPSYQTPTKRPKPLIDHSLQIAPLSQPGGVESTYRAPVIELERPPRGGRGSTPVSVKSEREDADYNSLRDRITQMERTMRW